MKKDQKNVLHIILFVCIVGGIILCIQETNKEGFTTNNPLFKKYHRMKRNARRSGIRWLRDNAYGLKKWLREERII